MSRQKLSRSRMGRSSIDHVRGLICGYRLILVDLFNQIKTQRRMKYPSSVWCSVSHPRLVSDRFSRARNSGKTRPEGRGLGFWGPRSNCARVSEICLGWDTPDETRSAAAAESSHCSPWLLRSTNMHYIDSFTGVTYPLSEPRWRGDSGGHLNLGDAPGLTRAQIDASVNSLWRYREALLVDAGAAVTLGEGWTPLARAQWDGISVLMKLDYLMPSGSFKDRGMTVMVTYLKRHGVTDVLEDSSGNAGASLSIYCAAAGTRCRVLVPATASYPKIAQIAACGAEVVAITGTRQDVADAALAMSREIFYASHNWQPLFAEGTKT